MILMSWSNSHGPNQPCRPNSSTKISPATTGDTAERQIDQRREQALAAEVEPGDRPRGRDAEDRVGRHRQRRDEERQPDRRERLRGLDRRHVRLPTIAERLDEDEGKWDDEKHDEEGECERHQRDTDDQGFGQPGARCVAAT